MTRQLERTARALALAMLAWLLWSALRPVTRARSTRVAVGDVSRRASDLVRDGEISSLHVDVDGTPAPADLELLAALRRAALTVTWSGIVEPLGVSAERVAEPVATTRISVAAPAGGWLRVSDRLGTLDSVRPAHVNAQLLVEHVESPVLAGLGRDTATAADVDSLILRPVLVVGSAGWETKFVVAALEERGWRVATRIGVAPGARVEQGNGKGSATAIDTTHYAAVVALDTSATSLGDAIARYVRSGGGLVLAGRSATVPALAPLAPAALGAHRAARPALVADSVTPRSLGRWALATPRRNTAAIARYGAELAVAARVVGAGRVIQTGSEESWRWRMEGVEGSATAHREWWSRLVASVAYAPTVARGARINTLAAPRAQIIDALGLPGERARVSSAFDPLRSQLVITLVFVLLLTEWASRRLHGAR